MEGKGIQAQQLRIDWQKLMRFKRSFTEPVPKQREEWFANAGIAAFRGRARFVGPSTVQVGEEVLEGWYVVKATAPRPAELKLPWQKHRTTSEQILGLAELPKRILLLGGGYIAFQ